MFSLVHANQEGKMKVCECLYIHVLMCVCSELGVWIFSFFPHINVCCIYLDIKDSSFSDFSTLTNIYIIELVFTKTIHIQILVLFLKHLSIENTLVSKAANV